ncbi:MAG TPA: gamma-glutamylcyclotransferase family protein [Candidatus Saccharimonadia bacterium]|nr:gamma-glutamylcyclotransferase family protein [Candidatus Saccharimonadia bacterium]
MRIFVYGTLKRGLSNHGWMAGQQFIAEAHTEPVYRMVNFGGYPGMYPVEQDGVSIQGEIWEVDEAGRAKLDVLESVEEGEYALELVRLMDAPAAEDGVMDPIYTYVYRWPVAGMPDAGVDWRL